MSNEKVKDYRKRYEVIFWGESNLILMILITENTLEMN